MASIYDDLIPKKTGTQSVSTPKPATSSQSLYADLAPGASPQTKPASTGGIYADLIPAAKAPAPEKKGFSIPSPFSGFKPKGTIGDMSSSIVGDVKKVAQKVYETGAGIIAPGITKEEVYSPSFLKDVALGIPKGGYEIAKEVVTKPVKSAQALVGGIARGVSDFTTNAIVNFLPVPPELRESTRSQVQQTLDKYLTPPETKITEGSRIAGTAGPLIGAGIAGRAAGATLGAPLLGEVAGFSVAGQTQLPLEATAEERTDQVMTDLIALGLFKAGSALYNKAKGTVRDAVTHIKGQEVLKPEIDRALYVKELISSRPNDIASALDMYESGLGAKYKAGGPAEGLKILEGALKKNTSAPTIFLRPRRVLEKTEPTKARELPPIKEGFPKPEEVLRKAREATIYDDLKPKEADVNVGDQVTVIRTERPTERVDVEVVERTPNGIIARETPESAPRLFPTAEFSVLRKAEPRAETLEPEIARPAVKEADIQSIKDQLESLASRLKTPASFKRTAESMIEKFVRGDEAKRTYVFEQLGVKNVREFVDRTKAPKQETANVADLERTVVETYRKAGMSEEVPTVLKADEMLSKILMQFELAEPGRREPVLDRDGYQTGYQGVPSTFPKWIPESLRSTKLFDQVIAGLMQIEKLKIPKGKPKLQKLYNLILDALDEELGVSTKAEREKITQSYEQPKKETDSRSIRGSTPRVSGGLGSLESPQGRKTINKIIERRSKEAEGVQEVPKAFKLSERAKQILNEFGVPIAEKELSSRLLGRFAYREKNVRVQALYDVTTVVHEGIHALDNKVRFAEKLIADTKPGAKIRNRLTDIYEELYPRGNRTHKLEKRIKEGLATFFENYFYDPAGTVAKYGDLVDAFIKPEGKYYSTEFTRLLDKMNELVDDYMKLSPEQRIGARIRTGKEVVEEKSGFTIPQRIIFSLFNRFEPLKRYAKQTGVSETWDDPFVQAFNIMNKNTVIYNWVKGDSMPVLKADGNWDVKKGSVAQYSELVKGKEDAFRSYLVARRVASDSNKLNRMKNDLAEMEAEGFDLSNPQASIERSALIKEIQNLENVIRRDDFSLQDALAVVNKYGTEFAKAGKIYDDVNKRLIDFSENSGLLDRETATIYRNEEGYTSFKRYIEDEIDGSIGTIQGSSKSKVSSFKGRTGSQLDLVDPVYNQIMSVNEIISKGLENVLWTKVARMTDKSPEIARRFEQIEVKGVPDAQGKISFPQEKDPSMIRIFVGGKRRFYKAAPEFLAVAKNLRPKELEGFSLLLRIPSSIFSRLTTSANPLFAAGNLSVDQFTAASQTKTGFKPIVDPIKSFMDYVQGDPRVKEYLAIGGKRQTLASYFDLSPDEISHKLVGGETKAEKVVGMIDAGIGILEIPSNFSEISTRFAEYRRALEAGDSMSVAMYKAADVTTPFQLGGNYGGRIGQEYVKSIPYLNAIIQVMYKFGRGIKDQPERVATVGAAIMTAGLSFSILTMKVGSEEQKRKIRNEPARNLARYIYVPHPNGKDVIKLRIPEQFGSYLGIANLYVIEKYGGNEATFDEYLESATAQFPDAINVTEPSKAFLGLIPQALKPSVLVAANTKTFPEIGPIVPDYMKDVEPRKQYNTYTSEVAKFMGDLMNTSPAKIDFWVRNQFGVVGGFLLGKVPGSPIHIQEQDHVLGGRSVNRFYDNKDGIEQQYKEMVKDNPDSYTYKQKYDVQVAKQAYNKVGEILSALRDVAREDELPEDIRQQTFNLLVEFDRTENILDTASDIANLGQKVNGLRAKTSGNR